MKSRNLESFPYAKPVKEQAFQLFPRKEECKGANFSLFFRLLRPTDAWNLPRFSPFPLWKLTLHSSALLLAPSDPHRRSKKDPILRRKMTIWRENGNKEDKAATVMAGKHAFTSQPFLTPLPVNPLLLLPSLISE